MTPLRPYQETSRDWLAAPLPAGDVGRLLADGPRVGKTWPAIDAARRLGAKTVNVICPASVVGNWQHFFQERAPEINMRAMSYDRAWRSDPRSADVLILDEAHFLKTPTTRRTLACYGPGCDHGGWSAHSGKTWALTGTPTPNYADEIWPTIRRLCPSRFIGRSGRPMNYYEFRDTFCEVADNGFGLRIVGNKNVEQLRKRLTGFVMRRTFDEVSGQIRPDVSALYLSAKWPAGIDDAVRLIAQAFEAGGVDALQQFRPPRGVPDEVAQGAIARMRRAIGLAKVLPVLDVIEPSLRTGEKVALYAHHTEVLDGLENGLQSMGVGYERIDGSVPTEKRTARARRFREDPKCAAFLGQNIAAGAGIDLSSADWMILVEPSYVPGENQQVVDRVLNIAKDRPVTVNFAAIAGTIDDKIQQANIRKMKGIAALLAA